MTKLVLFTLFFSFVQLLTHGQKIFKWKGYKIEDLDTIPMDITLQINDSLVSGKTYYYYNNGKNYKIYNVEGKISRNKDSISLYDASLEDKLMPPFCCNLYGDYHLVLDSGLWNGYWQEPIKTVFGRQEKADLTLVQEKFDSSPNIDSLITLQHARQRRDSLIKKIITTGEEIEVTVFDNAVLDGDMVSIFFNDSLVEFKYVLGPNPLVLRLPIDKKRMNCLKFVAENEGKIPPNTAFIKIKSSNEIFTISIPSSFKYNGTVVFEVSR